MAFEYIKEADLIERFSDAEKAALPLHQPFEEWERIARNQPHPSIARNMPKVTDGTLAALIQEQPKRVIQKPPTGVVTGADPILNLIAGYILQNEILPNCNAVAAPIQKSWAMTSKSLVYGSQPTFVQVVQRGDYFGTDFTLPYAKDVYLEPGKLSDRDSNIIWMVSWFAPNQIEAIIAKVRKLNRKAKRRGDEAPETGWDVPVLKKAMKHISQKDQNSQTPNEKGKNLDQGYVKLVTAFQVGIGAKFYTFSPYLAKGENVVRRKVNKDPRGKIPIHYMYANVDFSNPLGRGSVELSGGMQNLLDSEVQSYQYVRALSINPPLKIRGNIPANIIKYAPAAQWRMGSDPSADIEPLELSTRSLEAFPANYGLIKSQILNLNSSTDTSVSSEVGNPGFSKTDAGVKANDIKLGISDNYMRMQYEDTFQEICETSINLYFAERSGTQELLVDQETADKLRDIAPDMVNAKNQVRIDYDTETPKLHFKVDAGSSESEDDQAQIEGLQQMLKDISADPYINSQFQSAGKEIVVAEIYEQLFERYHLTGLDRIIKDIPEQKDADGNVIPPNTGGVNPLLDKPAIRMNYADLPPAAQVAALGSAGIQINPQDIGQPNITQQASAAAKAGSADTQDTNDLSNHPIVKLMDSLQIKFSDLPEDSKHELLAQIGLPSQEVTPVQQSLNTDKAKVVASTLPPPVNPLEAAKLQLATKQHEDQMNLSAVQHQDSTAHQAEALKVTATANKQKATQGAKK